MPTLRSADTYFKIYQTYVKSMPIQDRVNYLMAGVRLLDIDGGELDGFLEVICEDKAVQTAFMQKMEGLIKTLNPNTPLKTHPTRRPKSRNPAILSRLTLSLGLIANIEIN